MSVDPLVSQTDQPYVFTNDNPLNLEDPLGLISLNPCNWGGVCHKVHDAEEKVVNLVHRKGIAYVVLEGASFVPYTAYYAAYKGLKWTGKDHPLNVAVMILTLPLRPAVVGVEGVGLAGDIALDFEKREILRNGEPLDDEGHVGPLFGTDTGFGGPKVFLPGWGPKGVNWSF